MNLNLSKGITKKSKLRHKFLKSGIDEDRKRNRKQRNLCILLLRKTKWNYYSNFIEKNVTENRQFGRAIKSMLSHKPICNKKIILIKNQKILETDNEIEKTLNDLFLNIIKTFCIPKFN